VWTSWSRCKLASSACKWLQKTAKISQKRKKIMVNTSIQKTPRLQTLKRLFLCLEDFTGGQFSQDWNNNLLQQTPKSLKDQVLPVAAIQMWRLLLVYLGLSLLQ
jgi:hypothetical protein